MTGTIEGLLDIIPPDSTIQVGTDSGKAMQRSLKILVKCHGSPLFYLRHHPGTRNQRPRALEYTVGFHLIQFWFSIERRNRMAALDFARRVVQARPRIYFTENEIAQ